MVTEQRVARDGQAPTFGIEDTVVWYRRAQFREIVRFGISGLTSTIFYAVMAWLLVTLAAIQPVSASVLSYLLSLGVSYGLQSRFTFREKGDRPPQVLRFLVTAVLGLIVSYGLVFVATKILHWWFVIGNLTVCIVIPVANYFVLKLWVFAPAEHDLKEDFGVPGNE